VRRTLFTGFVEGNRSIASTASLRLDGWIYGANGDSGGRSKVLPASRRQSPEPARRRQHVLPSKSAATTSASPDTGEFEAIEGQTQYGVTAMTGAIVRQQQSDLALAL